MEKELIKIETLKGELLDVKGMLCEMNKELNCFFSLVNERIEMLLELRRKELDVQNETAHFFTKKNKELNKKMEALSEEKIFKNLAEIPTQEITVVKETPEKRKKEEEFSLKNKRVKYQVKQSSLTFPLPRKEKVELPRVKMEKGFSCRDCGKLYAKEGDRMNHEKLYGHQKWMRGNRMRLELE